jgi:hypothetical protein
MLKAIKPTAAKRSRAKISVYGAPGVGKTWGAMGFPGVYYVCTEPGNQLPEYMDRLEGNGGVYFGPDEGASDTREVLGQVRELSKGGHEFKTLVIDSVSKLWNSIITSEQERLGEKDAFGASKKPAVAFMRSLLLACDRLDMNTILIHHQKAKWFKQEQIGFEADGWDKTPYDLNLEIQVTQKGKNRFGVVTKSREAGFNLGESFPWNYGDFAERFGRDRLEATVTPYDFPSEDQLRRLHEVIDTLEISAEMQAKWKKQLGVDDYKDADAKRIEKLIDFAQNPTKKK